jgi:hypothetical protein
MWNGGPESNRLRKKGWILAKGTESIPQGLKPSLI